MSNPVTAIPAPDAALMIVGSQKTNPYTPMLHNRYWTVYVGPTAHTLTDNRRRRIAEDDLRIAADLAWITYTETLIAETTSALELTRGPLPGHHPGDQEILQPPFGHLTAHRPRPVCPGRYAQPMMTRIIADANWRDDLARMQQADDADQQRRH